MIDTFKMRLHTFPLLGTRAKNYSEFVTKEKPSKKIAMMKKAARAANADQRKIVKQAKRIS